MNIYIYTYIIIILINIYININININIVSRSNSPHWQRASTSNSTTRSHPDSFTQQAGESLNAQIGDSSLPSSKRFPDRNGWSSRHQWKDPGSKANESGHTRRYCSNTDTYGNHPLPPTRARLSLNVLQPGSLDFQLVHGCKHRSDWIAMT